ncbi:hypothetical protein K7X08_033611 [Anisodus acutangulus]|uniref:Uncharacterized protein n=1 Tax=Anisodus acutangulus TaxID=402998 RepID=A0A9Q1M6Z4_9SOLA|nr:hypothetical protein K7X08_033611 [Anisodus acutangulus]
MDGSVQDAPGSCKKREVKSNDMNLEKAEDPPRGLESVGADYEETKTKRRSVGKQSRKRKEEHLQPEHLEPPDGAGSKRNTSKKTSGSIRGRKETARSVLEKPNQPRRSERHRKNKLHKMNENDASNDYCPQELSNFETSAGVDTGGTEMESTVQPSFGGTDDPVPGDFSSKEYLKMAGGFFLEEDDEDMEHEINASSPILSVECSDIYKSSQLLGDENCGNASNHLVSSPSRKTGEKICEAGIGASEIEQDLNNTTNITCYKVSPHLENMENNDYVSGSVLPVQCQI